MRHVPERPASLQIGAVFGLFFLGPLATLQASQILTPESEIVHTASALAFVLVFVIGTLSWAGIVTEMSVPWATFCWMLVGASYGLLLWAAAHHGYLPFREPE